MSDRDRYFKMNQEIADFIEEYKKKEADPYLYEKTIRAKTRQTRRIKAESVTYKKISYMYKGRLHFRRVIVDYNKGG